MNQYGFEKILKTSKYVMWRRGEAGGGECWKQLTQSKTTNVEKSVNAG